MSQKRIALYAFLLVAGLIGLAIDRMVAPTDPRSAEASPTPTLVKASTVERSEEDLCEGPPIASIFSSSRKPPPTVNLLESFRDQMKVRDLFEMSKQMQGLYESKSEKAEIVEQIKQQQEAAQEQEALQAFDSTHQLKAVFIGPTGKWAVVDGQILAEGDALDGFVLKKIEPYRAIFTKDGSISELMLPRPNTSKVTPDSQR